MINILNKIAMALNSLVIILYAGDMIVRGGALNNGDVAVLILNGLSVILNGFFVFGNKEA